MNAGELVTIYRKIHLFDIDIPGKIAFKVNITERSCLDLTQIFAKESETLTGGTAPNFFDTGLWT
jgi:omega-amidase